MHISNYILLLQANPPYRCIPVLLKKSADTTKFHLNNGIKRDFLEFVVYFVRQSHIYIRSASFSLRANRMHCIFFVVAYSR